MTKTFTRSTLAITAFAMTTLAMPLGASAKQPAIETPICATKMLGVYLFLPAKKAPFDQPNSICDVSVLTTDGTKVYIGQIKYGALNPKEAKRQCEILGSNLATDTYFDTLFYKIKPCARMTWKVTKQ